MFFHTFFYSVLMLHLRYYISPLDGQSDDVRSTGTETALISALWLFQHRDRSYEGSPTTRDLPRTSVSDGAP